MFERLKRALARSDPAGDYGRFQREALVELFGSDVDRQFADHFHLKPQRPSLPDGLDDHPRLTPLSALGFPSLFVVSTYLDDATGCELEGSTRLPVPPNCWVCQRQAVGERSVSGNWLKPDGGRQTVHMSLLVCDEHSVDAGLPLIAVAERIPHAYRLTAVCNGKAFLSALAEVNSRGDFTPPWRIFAGELPEWGGWRQGNGEHWLHHVWLPFWNDLPDAERQRYLNTWDAPQEWREVVMDW